MNVYERVAEVMKEVEYLAKDDLISFKSTKYKAISEEKVTSTVRKSLIKNGLVIMPIQQLHSRVDNLSTVDVTYRIQNIEDKEDYVDVVSSGTGADTQDKGVGKAMTYAYKYMLLRTFAIPTGEDPDKVSSDELDDKQRKAEAAQREYQDAASAPADTSNIPTKAEIDELFKPIYGDKKAAVAVLKRAGLKSVKELTYDNVGKVSRYIEEYLHQEVSA